MRPASCNAHIYRIVDIEGGAALIGTFVNVRITEVSNPRRLRGQIINN